MLVVTSCLLRKLKLNGGVKLGTQLLILGRWDSQEVCWLLGQVLAPAFAFELMGQWVQRATSLMQSLTEGFSTLGRYVTDSVIVEGWANVGYSC